MNGTAKHFGDTGKLNKGAKNVHAIERIILYVGLISALWVGLKKPEQISIVQTAPMAEEVEQDETEFDNIERLVAYKESGSSIMSFTVLNGERRVYRLGNQCGEDFVIGLSRDFVKLRALDNTIETRYFF